MAVLTTPSDSDLGTRSSARGSKLTILRLIKHILLIAFGLLLLYPVIWMISSSFKPTSEIFSDSGLWPQTFTLDNYTEGWDALRISFATFFLNSFVIAILCIVGNLVSCSLAAYAFARLRFKGKRIWFAVMLITIMLPTHVVLIPQYILFSELGWLNTFLPLVVPKFLATDAFFIFLMVQFIRGLPRELDDAAKIDGCGFFGTFWRVILPLTAPALATTAIFTFIWTWNDFLTPLIYLTSPENYTVPLALRAFMDAEAESSWGPLFAMSVLSLGPIFGFFLAAQKYLVRGVATTGLKSRSAQGEAHDENPRSRRPRRHRSPNRADRAGDYDLRLTGERRGCAPDGAHGP